MEIDAKLQKIKNEIISGNIDNVQYLAIIQDLENRITKDDFVNILVRALFVKKTREKLEYHNVQKYFIRVFSITIFIYCLKKIFL